MTVRISAHLFRAPPSTLPSAKSDPPTINILCPDTAFHLTPLAAACAASEAMDSSMASSVVADGAIGECRAILGYWGVEDTGVVTAKDDEQNTDATRAKILQLVEKL